MSIPALEAPEVVQTLHHTVHISKDSSKTIHSLNVLESLNGMEPYGASKCLLSVRHIQLIRPLYKVPSSQSSSLQDWDLGKLRPQNQSVSTGKYKENTRFFYTIKLIKTWSKISVEKNRIFNLECFPARWFDHAANSHVWALHSLPRDPKCRRFLQDASIPLYRTAKSTLWLYSDPSPSLCFALVGRNRKQSTKAFQTSSKAFHVSQRTIAENLLEFTNRLSDQNGHSMPRCLNPSSPLCETH